MNTISPLSHGNHPPSHRYLWTLTSLKSLNRQNKVSSPPFWIPIASVPSTSAATLAKKESKEHRAECSTAREGEAPLSSSSFASTTVTTHGSDMVGEGREVGYKMRLTLAKGIVPAATEAEDSVGLVLDWLPPPPLPSGSAVSDIFSPPGLTTVTAFLLSPLRPTPSSSTLPPAEERPGSFQRDPPCGAAHDTISLPEKVPTKEGWHQESSQRVPASSSSSAALPEGKTSDAKDDIVLTSDSISVFFAEGRDLRTVLPDFILPAQWTTMTTTSAKALPFSVSSEMDPLASLISLRVLIEISFGGMAAATALLRPVTDTVTSLWWSVSSQLSSWMASSTPPTVTTAASATPASTTTTSTSNASLGDLFRRLDVHSSNVRANAEAVQEKVTAAFSSAAAATLPYLGVGKKGEPPSHPPHREDVASENKEGVEQLPTSASSSSSPSLALPRHPSPTASIAVRPAWTPLLPPQWADRKTYWEHLILQRLGSQPETYLTTPDDLSHLADRDLVDALENFGYSVSSLVSFFPAEESFTIPDGGVLPPLVVDPDALSLDPAERMRRQKKVDAVGQWTERQRWRQFLWKCAALGTCTVEEEVEVVLKVLNYNFSLPPPPSSLVSVSLLSSSVPTVGLLDASTPSTVCPSAIGRHTNRVPEAVPHGIACRRRDDGSEGIQSSYEAVHPPGIEATPPCMTAPLEGRTAVTKEEAIVPIAAVLLPMETTTKVEEASNPCASRGVPSCHPDAFVTTGESFTANAVHTDPPFPGVSTRVRKGSEAGDNGGEETRDTAPLSTVAASPSIPETMPEGKMLPHASATAAPCGVREKDKNDFPARTAGEEWNEMEFPRMPWEEEEDA